MDFSENSSTILQKALSGNDLAWDKLFHKLWSVITVVIATKARNIGGNPLIEDIAQNVFLRLMENDAKRLRLFDPHKGTLERYIATVANRCTVDYFRSNMKHFRNVDLSQLPEMYTDPDSSLMASSWEITAALKMLSPRENEVIQLLFKKHLSVAEAAEKLGITAETIRSVKSHALKKLKKFFTEK